MFILFSFALLALLLFFASQKNKYKMEMKMALPSAEGLYEYQKGICQLKGNVSVWNDKYSLGGKKDAGIWLWLSYFKLLFLSIFTFKYFGYSQFPIVFISSYGNISEVSRRKFSTEKSLQYLKGLKMGIEKAISDNDAGKILHEFANVYRFMYGIKNDEKNKPLNILHLKKPLKDILKYIEVYDVVNAYVVWRRMEGTKLDKMSDFELIVYGSIRLQLEKYIISDDYPLDPQVVYQNLQEFMHKLKMINYLIDSGLIWKIALFRNASIMLIMDALANGLRYKRRL